MLLTLGLLASQGRKMTSPVTIVALGVALLATRQALIGSSDEAGDLSVLLHRASGALSLKPLPFGPPAAGTFVVILAPILAASVLVSRALPAALAGALALALLSRGAPDVPLCALTLVIASITVMLAARDTRGFWASLTQSKSEQPGADTGISQAGGQHRPLP